MAYKLKSKGDKYHAKNPMMTDINALPKEDIDLILFLRDTCDSLESKAWSSLKHDIAIYNSRIYISWKDITELTKFQYTQTNIALSPYTRLRSLANKGWVSKYGEKYYRPSSKFIKQYEELGKENPSPTGD